MRKDFLIELGVEELPPKSLKRIGQDFLSNIKNELDLKALTYKEIKYYASPRRIAVQVLDLLEKQPDISSLKKGPYLAYAKDADGAWTKAALGWSKGLGINPEDGNILEDKKGQYLSFEVLSKGVNTKELLPEIIINSIKKIPSPRMMKWGNLKEEFIRPVHKIVALFGDEIIPFKLFNIDSGNISLGHRFLGKKEILINNASSYEEDLAKEFVIASFEKRSTLIKEDILKIANKYDAQSSYSESFLDEISSIVEFPTVLEAKFETKYLDLPQEILINTMESDQKYFPLYKNGKLIENFIFVSNINPKDKSNIINGNERVIRPRFSDAEFFVKEDLKTPLISKLEELKDVVYQTKLGSMYAKTIRIVELARYISSILDSSLISKVEEASFLAKCDLRTQAVFEFPETQGVMGMYYASRNGVSNDISLAIREQYYPRFAKDNLPSNLLSSIIALAEKIDTIVGILGINQIPKGDKDPFALRRAALGINRILIENKINLNLLETLEFSIKSYKGILENQNILSDSLSFIQKRLVSYYQDKFISQDIINAVLETNSNDIILDCDNKIYAIDRFKKLGKIQSIVALNKRISNILNKADISFKEIESNLFENEFETSLYKEVLVLKSLDINSSYDTRLDNLSNILSSLDNFFENTFINSEDIKIRENRLSLLNECRTLFLAIADFSLIQAD
ncbi:MAG: glycine--tRNA ligase subunit beta [Psittacicella sp.]